LSTLLINKK